MYEKVEEVERTEEAMPAETRVLPTPVFEPQMEKTGWERSTSRSTSAGRALAMHLVRRRRAERRAGEQWRRGFAAMAAAEDGGGRLAAVGWGLSDYGRQAFKLGRQHRSLWSQSGVESWGPG